MSDHWIMTHIKWLCMIVMVLGSRSAFCTPSLLMKKTLQGVRRDSVVIPCTYTPSEQHEEVRIDWFFGDNSIIYRFQSEDHIPLIKFRTRVSLPQSPPGDVSLTIKDLDVEDKGNFKCKVTWKESGGNFVTKEDITHLQILRVRPHLTIATTKQPEVSTVKPETDKPNVRIVTSKEPEDTTMKPFTTKPSVIIVTTKDPEVTTRTSHSEDVSSVSKINTTKSSRTIAQTGKFHGRTTVISMSITDVIDNHPEFEARTGSGIHFYLLIIAISCLLCIIILIIVLIARKNKQKEDNWNSPMRYRQVLDLEDPQSCDNRPEAGNNYQPCNPQPVPIYEGLMPNYSNDYEVTLVKRTEETMKTF